VVGRSQGSETAKGCKAGLRFWRGFLSLSDLFVESGTETPDDIQALFTREGGSYLFARWGRPMVPVVFGVQDATLQVVP
jgi:hypothetical protein